MTATTTVPKTPSPHTKPALAALVPTAIGVLTLIYAFYHSGHIPSSAEVAAVVSGSGLSLGGPTAFVAHYIAWGKKNALPVVQAAAPAAVQAIDDIPGARTALDSFEARVLAAVHTEVAKLPAPLQADVATLEATAKAAVIKYVIPGVLTPEATALAPEPTPAVPAPAAA
jgi:hypothetical protein